MEKQRYASFRKTLAAGEVWNIPAFGSNLRILANSNSTNPELSINGGPFYEIAAGLGVKGLQEFTRLELRNPAATSMELWIAVTLGDIEDSRAMFAETLEVTDNSDNTEIGTILAVNSNGVIPKNDDVVNAGGGIVYIKVHTFAEDPFVPGDVVVITGTTNYDGTYTLLAADSGGISIAAAYVAETLDGDGSELIALATQRSIPANSDRKEVIITNMDATYRIYVGDDSVSSTGDIIGAVGKGIPVEPGASIVLTTQAAIYITTYYTCDTYGVLVNYMELEKS